VVPALAESFRVMVYDRRGHSRSERPKTQGSVHEDADDLAALLESLDLAPAHVASSSYGGNVALRLAAARPELFRSLSCHEPPLWQLLADDPEGSGLRRRQAALEDEIGERIAAGDCEGAARMFVDELAFGTGTWDERLPPQLKAIFIRNAPTFLDELQDPDAYGVDLPAISRAGISLQLTKGTESPGEFASVIDRLADALPQARRETIEGAGHVPQLTMPERYVQTVTAFARMAEALA
jgi:pimeloyl-ACP methyl ester carboxylesterase